jgi:hypothetical protein
MGEAGRLPRRLGIGVVPVRGESFPSWVKRASTPPTDLARQAALRYEAFALKPALENLEQL